MCLEEYPKVSFISAGDSNYCVVNTDPPSQPKSLESYQIPSRDSTSFITVAPPPMPEYPLDWNEQDERESFSPTRPGSVASQGSHLGTEKHNRFYNRLGRYLRAMFILWTKSSEAA
jgi:hypothetical protein